MTDQLNGGDSVDRGGQKKGKGTVSSSSLSKQQKKGAGRAAVAAGGGGGAGAGSAGGFQEQPALAVASNSLVVFARLAELCQIGTRILRSTLLRSAAAASGRKAVFHPTGFDNSSRRAWEKEKEEEDGVHEEGEEEAAGVSSSPEELLRQLQEWEDGLGPDLRIGTSASDRTDAAEAGAAAAAVALVKERPRWTVAMHLVLATLQLRLLDSAECVFRAPVLLPPPPL